MPQIPPITDAYIDEIIKAPDAYNPTLNKTQGVKLRELLKLMRDKIEEQSNAPGNGTGQLTAVTYQQLVNLIQTNALIPGRQYLLTDYKMYWKISVESPDLRESVTIEPLILSAIAANKLSSIAKSTLYSQDIIYYSIGRLDYNNVETPYDPADNYWTYFYKGIVPVKGLIFRRIDVNKKLDINFDYKGFWVESTGSNIPIETQLNDNVTIIQSGLDNQYGAVPIIIPFSTLKNCKITIGFNGYYGGNADKLCPATYNDLKLVAYNSEIDFFYIRDEQSWGTTNPNLQIVDSKLTKFFWLQGTPSNWNKVLDFTYTSDNYQPYPGESYYASIPGILPVLANKNVKVSVDYHWNSKQYSVLEMDTAATGAVSIPTEIKYYREELQ
ncbi:hypothetical protein [Pedobacter sp.]|uniref:hypothetical protein n=1 Tax=Pedobacter sp. TaxID=1411316 RepID=UPI0031D7431B